MTTDHHGVPLTFTSVHETRRGAIFAKPLNQHGLPMECAPEAVRAALAELDKLTAALDAADAAAEDLWAEYRAVPAETQRAVAASVRAGKPVSAAKLTDAKQGKLSGPLRDAVAVRDALSADATTAHARARRTIRECRDEWRDAAAAYVVENAPAVRKRIEDAVTALESALAAAAALDGVAKACHSVDREWLDERAVVGARRPGEPNYAGTAPEVFKVDQDNQRKRARNAYAGGYAAPVDIVGEARKRAAGIASLSNGGNLPDALTVPLASHPPVVPPKRP